jgi:hypothetical protein
MTLIYGTQNENCCHYALRLPDSLFKYPKLLVEKEHTSINQLFVTAIAEKIFVLETLDLLSGRAKSADEKLYLQALSKVKSRKAQKGDEI